MGLYENYKKTIEYYLKDEATGFLAWLDTTDARTAPSSIRHGLNKEGGWVEHQINVLDKLIKVVGVYYNNDIPSDLKPSMVKVALLHDLYKLNRYEKFLRNVKDENGQWVQVEDYKVKENFEQFINNNFTSVVIANRFFKLSDAEMEAIYYSTPSDSFRSADDFNVGGLADSLRYAIKWALSEEKNG